jgi:hypothetical protein
MRFVTKASWSANVSKEPKPSEIQATLLKLAKPKMTPRELLKAARKAHPEASKKEIIRAAFASIIAVADSDVDKALVLQEFAIKERGSEETN